MTSYYEPADRVWSPMSVRGTAMEMCPIFEDDDTRSALFRMAPGCQIPDHHHTHWVQVAVMSGRMRVEQDGCRPGLCPPAASTS